MLGITNYTVRTRRVTGTESRTDTFGLCGGHADVVINTLTHNLSKAWNAALLLGYSASALRNKQMEKFPFHLHFACDSSWKLLFLHTVLDKKQSIKNGKPKWNCRLHIHWHWGPVWPKNAEAAPERYSLLFRLCDCNGQWRELLRTENERKKPGCATGQALGQCICSSSVETPFIL